MSELERRAQIEEVWARRNVFADSMQAERLAEYLARRDLARLGCYGFPEPAKLTPPRPRVSAWEVASGAFALPRPRIAVAHYARSVSPDSIAALMTGLAALRRTGQSDISSNLSAAE